MSTNQEISLYPDINLNVQQAYDSILAATRKILEVQLQFISCNQINKVPKDVLEAGNYLNIFNGGASDLHKEFSTSIIHLNSLRKMFKDLAKITGYPLEDNPLELLF